MSDKRYLGNIITPNPTEPAGPFQDGAASGVWSLGEAFTYTKAGLWPTAGNVLATGLFGGGVVTPTRQNVIEYIRIATTGNSTDFGDLTVEREQVAAASSLTRGLFAGGRNNSSVLQNTIDYVTILSTGSAVDFGDLTVTRRASAGSSNATLALFAAGETATGDRVNTIDFVTIASTGNATDFGDLTYASTNGVAAGSNTTRGIFLHPSIAHHDLSSHRDIH
jgi:hypothetical protein